MSGDDGSEWSFDVVSGDELRIEFTRSHADGARGEMFILAGLATIEGEPLPEGSWKRDVAGSMSDRISECVELPPGREVPIELVPDLDREVGKSIAEAGRAFAVHHGDLPDYVAFTDKLVAAKESLQDAEDWSWLCGFGRPFRLRLTVP